MTRQEARDILLLCRDAGGTRDPKAAEALRMAREDQELGAWFDQHLAFQAAMRSKLQSIEPPARLKETLLAQSRILRPSLWRRQPAWWAMAATIVILAALAAFWPRHGAPDTFAGFQSRVVRYALREYAMDVRTNDMRAVREFMAANGAPADYVLPQGLQRTPLAGGGFLRWRNRPVAMVCFHRDETTMLYLFVLDRASLKDAPPAVPTPAAVSKLRTVSWSDQRLAYVLAGPDEPGFAEKYLGNGQ